MPTSCSAFGCSNHNLKPDCKNREVSFFKFPHSDEKLMEARLVKIEREDFVPSLSSKLCSDHFDPQCFKFQKNTERRLLKKDAIPSIFSFTTQKSKRKRTSYSMGVTNGNNDDVNDVDPHEGTSSMTFNQASQTDNGFSSLIDELGLKNNEISLLKSQLNRNFNPEEMGESELRAFSGVSKEIFFKFFAFLNLYGDLRDESLSVMQQYFLFMMKLKTGITLDFLAYIFKVSRATASRTFCKVVDVIYAKLKSVDIFPSDDQIKEFMPYAFSLKYPKCKVIIDCTEIYIQKPFSPREQQLTFSNYKNDNTMKALVGISPSGGISFISDLWCGSISDKEMFLRSGLLGLLKSGDVVLADKGFQIDDELKNIGVVLAKPLFARQNIQFSLDERGYNKGVSHLRVHVERAISRIKIFKYFEGTVPYTSLHNLNEVFYIAAFLTNFNNPLISVKPAVTSTSEP